MRRSCLFHLTKILRFEDEVLKGDRTYRFAENVTIGMTCRRHRRHQVVESWEKPISNFVATRSMRHFFYSSHQPWI